MREGERDRERERERERKREGESPLEKRNSAPLNNSTLVVSHKFISLSACAENTNLSALFLPSLLRV
jgi:hypothetical protein